MSDILENTNETWSDCDEEWEEDVDVNCPFCTGIFTNPMVCFNHSKSEHSFDFHAIKLSMQLDFFGCMRLVNYSRRYKYSQETVIAKREEWIANDEYLVPIIQNDPMLYAFESLIDEEGEQEREASLLEIIEDLNAKLNVTQSNLQEYKEMVHKKFISPTDEDDKNVVIKDEGNYYFQSYASNEIHEQMLRDTIRTDAYRDFIYANKNYFKNKCVLDVGCGTGILSMFSAKAGSRRVISIDNSDIIQKAKMVVKENKLEHVIECTRVRAEDLQLDEKVDVIVSEWMGYFLLFESMFDSVIATRDKWLKDDGIMCPSRCRIFLAGFGDPEWYNDKINFWNDVYGFKMNSMKNGNVKDAFVTVVKGDEMVSNSIVLKDFDLKSVKASELDFETEFVLDIEKDGKVYAFCGWFDSTFSGPNLEPVTFTTGPYNTPTHWMQTLFVLENPLVVQSGDQIRGNFKCSKALKNPRELDVLIHYNQIRRNDTLLSKVQSFGVI